MKEVRIIVAGSREFDYYEVLVKSISNVIFDLECRNVVIGNASRQSEKHLIKFISGTARGADQLGERFATNHGYEVFRFPADWDTYGKSAGYRRNADMAKFASEGDNFGVLIAFWNGKSRGTKNMIDLAKRYGLEVHIVNF